MTRFALALVLITATTSPGLGRGPSTESGSSRGLRSDAAPGPSLGLSLAPGSAHSAAQTSAQSPGQIADLAWLAGHWAGSDGPMQMEEIWTSADGGALVGLHKDISARGGAARMVSFEFLRIEAGADGVAYVAQPGGRPPTRFGLVESGPRRAVFANPAHDFPQRIVYWIDDAGALHARVEGPKGGKTVGQEWTWTRRALK
ncbi:MAG: DUF6265 family protein [Vicinamibacteraceae bacterium]